ncbi:WSC domain-containing protein [Cercophora scortea]|uniref:WSC domain-containing protein n=1 Tax=Cercophora scortea TaxID=314031 RepID=A0AAE0MMJ3_9PEZI|nr:WSC domain-containing protein [Cercophora scortea]
MPSLSTALSFILLILLLNLTPTVSAVSVSAVSVSARAADQTPAAAPAIYSNATTGYIYLGCYNETTAIAGTSGDRALAGGTNEVKPGNMTVETCLGFCATGATRYKYAGLEFARECWCAQELSVLAKKQADSECNLPCEGDKTEVCGGSLKLTVYTVGGGSGAASSIRVAWTAGAVAVGAAALSLGLL